MWYYKIPILRGRDIKRYSYEWANLWIINTHNGYKKDNVKIPPIDIQEYPALKAYFDDVANKNKSTKGKGFFNRDDKGITPYNLRNCAYIGDFARQKIIYPNMAKEFIAYLDNDRFFTNQKCFILTQKDTSQDRMLYLTAILNSKVNFWYFKQIGATLVASGYEMSKIFVEKLPIPTIADSKLLQEIEQLVSTILESKKARQDTKELEQRLDSIIYKIYHLTQEEIDLIESKQI